MPATKRTKFLPIVLVDKEVRISSKNRVAKRRTPHRPSPSLSKSCKKINNLIVDDVSGQPHGTVQLPGEKILPVESPVAVGSVGYSKSECLSNSPSFSSPELCSKNNVHGDDAEVWHISMSRWALEEDSPPQKGSRNGQSISPRKRMEMDTPESGEFLGGISESYGSSDRVSERVNDEVDSLRLMESLYSEVVNEDAAPAFRSLNMRQACRSMCEYEKLGRISEGTYGVVYKARDKETGEIVALKKVKMGTEREGFPQTALREINLLLALHHPSIIDVKEIVMDGNDDVYMVMEYMEYDLRKLIELMKQPFSENEVKCLMLQLLEGIKDLHDNWILHRDLKTSNILISKSGKLKICDFGMSRQYGTPLKPFTALVVTLWYRAPELLLGAKQYSTAVDMWSVGCIMAELLAQKPLFDGETEVRQLDKIFRTLGPPTEVTWPGLADLPGAKASFANQPRNTLRDKFPALSFKGSPVLSERGFDLLSQLLTYDPEKRITAEAALAHGWFDVESKQELQSAQESLARKIKTLV